MDDSEKPASPFNFLSDIGVKVGLGISGSLLVAGTIVNPNSQQKNEAAQKIFKKPYDQLDAQDRAMAEFGAGYTRWDNFMNNALYPVTRNLPGSTNPIIDPTMDNSKWLVSEDSKLLKQKPAAADASKPGVASLSQR